MPAGEILRPAAHPGRAAACHLTGCGVCQFRCVHPSWDDAGRSI